MKHALITGHAGFVGRHMRAALQADGWAVTGADPMAGGSCDAREVFRADRTVYDLVVHCAYNVGGRAAIDGEPWLLAKNLELDAGLFDWALRTGQRRVLYFSSSAAYPIELQTARGGRYRLREDTIQLDRIQQPDANYGWAKLTGERLAAQAAQCGLAVHIVRPFSGYGADQSPVYPFPAIVARAQAHTDGPFTVWGPPGQTRDWIHISDVVAGALAVVDADERRPVNLCTGIGTEFGDLARLVLAALRKQAPIEYDIAAPTGVSHRVGHPARMHKIYTPKVSLAEGIDRALNRVRTGG